MTTDVRRSRTAGLAALGLFLLSAGCGQPASGKAASDGAAAKVHVQAVQKVDVRREVEAVGTLAARDEAVVSAEVEARVAKISADLGDRVAEGAALVVLDGEKLRDRADEQRASLEQTRARYGARGDELPAIERTPDVLSAAAKLAEAEQQVARAERLASRSLVSQQELEQARTQLATAQAAHETALAAARQLRAEIEARAASARVADREFKDTVIRAPFDGVVAERLVSAGQFVGVHTPVMRLVRLQPLRVLAEIPERFGPSIRVGHVIGVRVDAYPGREIEGTITRISPAVNQKSRAFAIEGEVPNADGSLKPGTFARVRIVTDRVDSSLVVPVSAVQTRYGTSRVFLVKNGALSGVEVKLGDRLGPRVELLEGVTAGAAVVSDNVEGLEDGMKVEAQGSAK